MKRQYFFGSLFVSGAKIFAILVMLAGIGFCQLQYSQAKAAAAAAMYKPSSSLQQVLVKLQKVFSATGEIVDSFGKDNQTTALSVESPHFPAVIDSDADFAGVGDELLRIDRDRQRWKQSLVSRFETSVATIEEKLRNYAASVQSSGSPASPETSPSSAITDVLAGPSQAQNSLFSTLDAGDVKKRNASLAQRKEFLKFLESKAENADNRAILNEAANEVDQLGKLLPEKMEKTDAAQLDASALQSREPSAQEGHKPVLSARVAGQLEQVRSDIKQALLTSWKLDAAFDQATELTSVEREKCRVATLAQKGIWLSAGSKILPGLLVAVLLSFLILVFADLVRTFLDTAAHTGTVAEAINALRGSVTHLSEPLSEPVSLTNTEEEIFEEGGS